MDPSPAFEYEIERRRAAVAHNYVTPAVISMVLYLGFWLPGLIANVIFWQKARRDQTLTGHAPLGKGCLVWLLVVFGAILPLLSLVAFAVGYQATQS